MPLVEYVTVVESDRDKNPACSHGPALLFDRVGKRFFACSACRDRKLCPLYVGLDTRQKFKTWRELRKRHVPREEHRRPPQVSEGSQFCSECCRIYSRADKACSHHNLRVVSPSEAEAPSAFLAQFSSNKGHAQYHFDEDTLEFIVRLASKFDKVLCLGTPSIFERLRPLGVNCHLADIDRRLEAFYPSDVFTWFNMFNGLAFRDDDRSTLWKFVEESQAMADAQLESSEAQSVALRRNLDLEKTHLAKRKISLHRPKRSLRGCKRTEVSSLTEDTTQGTQSAQAGGPSKKRRCKSTPIEIGADDSKAELLAPLPAKETLTKAEKEGTSTDRVNRKPGSEFPRTLASMDVCQPHNPRDCEERLGSALVVVDPPFGALLSPLSTTLKQLTKHGDWNTVLVFPYFNESQIRVHFPSLAMCDLAVRYRNQRKMKDDSSPVRIFTDVPLNRIPLPAPSYKYCAECSRWVHSVNTHCTDCGICPSKNHAPTRHCSVCQRCVKQTWDHCPTCKHCHLSEKCGAHRGGVKSVTSTSSAVPRSKRKSAHRRRQK